MSISESYNSISQCNRCGFCQAACPVFRSTGHESGVARGRLALLRAIVEDRLDWSQDLEDPLFDCLLCGACTANCFPAIPTADLMVGARSEYLNRVGRKPIHRLLFEHLLPYPRRLRAAARSVSLGKRTGVSRLSQALGLLKIFGQDALLVDGAIDQLAIPAFREKYKPGMYPGIVGRSGGNEGRSGSNEELPRIGYFVGCGADLLNPRATEATFDILKTIAKSVTVMDNCCCGLPAQVYGDIGAAQALAEKNLEALSGKTFDLLVTDCASCASFLKKYPSLFPKEGARFQQAEQIATKVRDIVEMLAETKHTDRSDDRTLIVTYHDPCHASRGQGLVKEPRAFLKALPGIEFREMPEADWCCGGAGAYALSHRDLSARILDRKIENLKTTGADVLVTSCPACILHLSHGIRRHGLPVTVRHISEMV
ncbi:MAG: (Fe-S)-binding protein [Desulfobacterales bacterium]